jgi:transketolase
MRTTFVKTLTALAKEDPSIWLLTGDLGFTVLEQFRDALPDQYLNAGVAEQNMVGVAAGLAMTGKRVFTYSIVPFATFRCYEHIRNDVCYHELPVCIVGVGGGYSYGHMGSTHHALEDIAALRCLPNMTVVCPGDPTEVEGAVKAICKHTGPCYLRLGKAGEPRLHDQEKFSFTLGKAIQMMDGEDCAVIGTSNMLETAVKTAGILKAQGLRPRLLSMPTVKPIDTEALAKAAQETRVIATIEEHVPVGGLGSAVAEAMAPLSKKPPHLIFATPDRFADTTGSQQFFRSRAGLEPESIAATIIGILNKKNAMDCS